MWLRQAAALLGCYAGSIVAFRFQYQPGVVYQYAYAVQVNMTAGAASQLQADDTPSQGFNIDSVVTLTPRGTQIFSETNQPTLFEMTLSDVHASRAENRQMLTADDDKVMSSSYAQLLSQFPCAFDWDQTSGAINRVFFASEEPAWSSNIKRGILSALQVLISGDVDKYGSVEFDSSGQCQYDYSVTDGADTINIKKVQTPGSCEAQKQSEDMDEQLTDPVRFSSQRQAVYTLRKSGILEDVTVTDETRFMPVDLTDGGDAVETVTTTAGSLTLQSTAVNSEKAIKFDSLDLLAAALAAEFNLAETAMVQGDVALDMNEYDYDGERPAFASSSSTMRKLIQAIAADRLGTSGKFGDLVQRAKSEKSVQAALLDMVTRDPVDSYREVAVDVLVATGRKALIEKALDIAQVGTNFEAPPEDIIVRVLMGVAYLPPLPFTFNVVMSLTDSSNLRIRKTATLALGALINNEWRVRHKLSKNAVSALDYLETSLRSEIAAVGDGPDLDMFLYSLGNAGQDRSAVIMMALLDPSRYSAKILSDVITCMRRMEMKNVDESVRLRLLKLFVDDKTMANEPLRLKALHLLLVQPRMEELEAVVDKLVTIKSNYLWARSREALEVYVRTHAGTLAAELSSMITVMVERRTSQSWPWQRPIVDQRNEILLAGNSKLAAYAGYSATVFNPLTPSGDEKTILDAKAFSRVIAFNQSYSVIDARISLKGDVSNADQTRPMEAYSFISVGGNFWIQCFDLLGNVCGRTDKDSSEANAVLVRQDGCYGSETPVQLFHWGTNLFSMQFKFPLVWGLVLKLTAAGSTFVNVTASAKGCLLPPSADTTIRPNVGFDVHGEAAINAYFVKAAAAVHAKVMHSDLPTIASLKMKSPPVIELCANGTLHQKPLQASIKLYMTVRNDAQGCDRGNTPSSPAPDGQLPIDSAIPCRLGWGSRKEKDWSWKGLEEWEINRDLFKYCKKFFDQDNLQKAPGRLVAQF